MLKGKNNLELYNMSKTKKRLTSLEARVSNIEKSTNVTFTTSTLIEYLEGKVTFKLSAENVRKKVRSKEIPSLKNEGVKGKRMLFDKLQIDKWLEDGRNI